VYVGDVADALVAAGSAEGLAGQTIDIGSGERTSVREVVERITALVAPSIEPRFSDVPDRALEHERVADVERTRTLLGWSSSTSLDDGLARTVEWYRAQAEAGRAAMIGILVGVGISLLCRAMANEATIEAPHAGLAIWGFTGATPDPCAACANASRPGPS
jgi:hypothetical protein